MPHFVQGNCTNSWLLPGSTINTTEQLLETLGFFGGFSFSFFFLLFFKHALSIWVWIRTSDQVVKRSVSD